jgi:hypothetical protein
MRRMLRARPRAPGRRSRLGMEEGKSEMAGARRRCAGRGGGYPQRRDGGSESGDGDGNAAAAAAGRVVRQELVEPLADHAPPGIWVAFVSSVWSHTVLPFPLSDVPLGFYNSSSSSCYLRRK